MNGLEWGTVPAWLSAVLTGGSLLMGFHILLRDRKKDERNEALKIVTWAERDANDEGSFIRIHVRNTADRPILYVDALYEGAGGIERLPSNVPMVLKDEEITLEVPRYMNGRRTLARGIAFQDANGFSWVRDIASHDVYRQSRLRRGDPTLRMLFLSFGSFRLYRSTKKRMRRA
ncbi:hypothetical protein [Streptomyces lincolnensis]|uniref:hypothetical protein n=1 Tax=Streptomyces lincolnensis TaxID=1915 RepID=UPI000DF74779|nr:hypothetical protein [Streptomyces lincolnensis]QMV08483.1 hypothetical protein GJU35_24470 [Streptomyces lincolnensis]